MYFCRYGLVFRVLACFCILTFLEICNGRELFNGKEAEGGGGVPFQKEQCEKIFRVLGIPTPTTWPSMDKLPEYEKVKSLAREKKYPYPATSELKKVLQVGRGPPGQQLYDLISKMLDFGRRKTSSWC